MRQIVPLHHRLSRFFHKSMMFLPCMGQQIRKLTLISHGSRIAAAHRTNRIARLDGRFFLKIEGRSICRRPRKD
jgi:hypothetical protein